MWIFLENLSTAKKIDILSKLYESHYVHLNFSTKIKKQQKRLFQLLDKARIKRDVYVHSNWLNDFNGELVEYKTKRLKSGEYGRIHKNISMIVLEDDLNLIISLQNELYDFNSNFFYNCQKALNER